MKAALPPIYRAEKARYVIDRCQPQLKAISEGKIRFHALTNGNYPGQRMAQNVLPGVSSLGFWDAAGPQNWGLDTHRNEGIELVFLETGATPFVVDDQSYNLHAGNFTITRPWQLHKLGTPNIGPGRLHWLIIDVDVRRPNQDWRWPPWVMLAREDLAELTRKLRHNEDPVWTATPAITQAFQELSQCTLRWGEKHSVSRAQIYLNGLLLGVLEALTEQQREENPQLTSRQRTVELFLRDLEQNPATTCEAWTLDCMAQHCGMGVTAFSKYCRQLVNAGPVEYLKQCRLVWAARQLREKPDKAITEIALECGFNSSQYFATCFRESFHCPPREYRESSLAAQSPMASRRSLSLSRKTP